MRITLLSKPDNNSAEAQVFRAVQNGLLDFCVASVNPDMSQIEQFIDGPYALDTAAFAAAYFGKIALLNFFLEQVADINEAVKGAAQAGNQLMVDDLIKRGANRDRAACEAAYYNQHALVYDLVTTQAANVHLALIAAVRAGHKKLADDLTGTVKMRNRAVKWEAVNGRRDRVEVLLRYHANIDEAIAGARAGNQGELLAYLEKQKQKPLQPDLKPSASTVSWGSMFGHRTSVVSQKPLSEETGHAATI